MSLSKRSAVLGVVVTYNGEQWIEACLDSLAEQTGLDGVMVVDNASSDATVELVRQRAPSVDVIELSKNIGFGRANNIGIQKALDAGAEYIGLFNQDLKVEKGALHLLLKQMNEDPQYGLLSALQLNYVGSHLDPRFREYIPPSFWDDMVLKLPNDVYQTDFVPAAAIVIRRQVLCDVGGFDPLFFLYSEDHDLCYRIARAGWKLGFVPAARVRHWHTAAQIGDEDFTNPSRWHGRALRSIKTSRRSVPMALLGLVWRWLVPHWRPRFLSRVRAVSRCVPLLLQIHHNRKSVPHRFRLADEMRFGDGSMPVKVKSDVQGE